MNIIITQIGPPIPISFFPGSSGGGTSAPRRRALIYTASGTIDPSVDLAIANSVNPIALTLPAGQLDCHELVIKRFGDGSLVVTASLDGVSGEQITMDGAGLHESATLIWSSALRTWIVLASGGSGALPDNALLGTDGSYLLGTDGAFLTFLDTTLPSSGLLGSDGDYLVGADGDYLTFP